MKRLSLLLAVISLVQTAARAETTEERQKKALETLRQRVAEENAHPRASVYSPLDPNVSVQVAQAETSSSQRNVPSYADMEKQYLNGKISQRQYQKYLREHPVDPAAQKQVVNSVPAKGAVKVAPPVSTPAIKPSPTPPVVAPPSAAETTNKLNDVEAKMDELIKQKEARDKALKNATPSPEPKTKRDKLNAILKLYVDEKITEQEYNQRRQKILAEPGD
ncbi:MAG: hypothetical protein JWM16_4166 [Verrucomicrobiales bacterium]|nr:hypothetical protein [Verrucomicrobiales bacterium]